MSYGQKISGHFTQGHVDTVAKVKRIVLIEKTWVLTLQLMNKKLQKLLIEKASVSINGVFLQFQKFLKIHLKSILFLTH